MQIHLVVLQMTEPVTELFSKILPSSVAKEGSVASPVACTYAEGMCAYYTAFQRFRDAAMNYESLPDYLNAQPTIMAVPKEQMWPYSPHFRKCVSLTLQTLFKTKIVSFCMSPVSMDQTLVFVDEQKNRWIMSTMESPDDPALNLIYMHFPRRNTPICGHTLQAKALSDPFLSSSGMGLVVTDTSDWGEMQTVQ